MPETIHLRPYQEASIRGLRDGLRQGHRCQILCAPTGSGKCHPAGTMIMMHNGESRAVEDICRGDVLMGPGGAPRKVLSTSTGHGDLFLITPVKGTSWGCNADHVLTLVHTESGETVDIPLNEYLSKSNYWRHCHKLFRSAVDFPEQSLPVDPYFMGVVLGDGCLMNGQFSVCKPDPEIQAVCEEQAEKFGLSLRIENADGPRAPAYYFSASRRNHNASGHPVPHVLRVIFSELGLTEVRSVDKFIPKMYRIGSRSQRLELLAGLLDTDGHMSRNGFDFISASIDLARDVVFVARSVGLAAYLNESEKHCPGHSGTYYRVSISGNTSEIPTRIPRKKAATRRQKKDVSRTGFHVSGIGKGDYYGFTLDSDGRYLLADFTVTHNTVMATSLLLEVQRKGTRAAFVVDRVALCQQTSNMLQFYGIRHGVAQSNNTFGRLEPIQVCSAQTIEKRGFWPAIDLVIIDEAHTLRKQVIEFAQNISAPVIGLTATPFSKGLGEIYSHVVNVTTTDQLIEDGYLAPLKVYIAKPIDMTGAKVVRGEWKERDIEQRSRAIIGDIVTEWTEKTQLHFGGPVKTIVFSATVAHGDELCRQFQAAGFNFQQVSYKDKNDERRAGLIEEFRKPDSDIVGLVSCEALAKGFDVPDIQCGICARPYRKSFSAHIQMIGRAMRSFPGKDYALWLDHAGNYLGFYDQMVELFGNGVDQLDNGERDKQVRKEVTKETSDMACNGCGYAPLTAAMDHCPSCGKARVRRNRVEILPGRMVEIDGVDTRKHPYLQDATEAWRQICRVALDRKKDEESANRFALAQYRNFYGRWPAKSTAFDPAENVDPRLRSHITANVIRWAKAQGRKVA